MATRAGHDRDRVIGNFARGFGLFWLKGRMRARAARILLLASLAAWITIAAGYVWMMQPSYTLAGGVRWLAAVTFDQGLRFGSFRFTVDTDAGPQLWSAAYIRTDPWHREQVQAVGEAVMVAMLIAMGLTLALGLLAFAGLRWLGHRAQAGRILRGRGMITDRDLASRLRRAGKASDLTLGGVPMVKATETYNTLLLGAQGTGKTEAIKQILDRIGARGEAAIVTDVTGTLLPLFYDPGRGDVILNPLDQRGACWSPWAEIKRATDCKALASSVIPIDSVHEPFWGRAARRLLEVGLDHLRNDPARSVEALFDLLTNMPREEKRRVLAGSPVAKMFEENAERTGLSVEINTDVYLDALGILPAHAGGSDDFSIARFIAQCADRPKRKARRPWLWLPARQCDLETVRPLISCWADCAARALLSLPEDLDRRLWLILDELPSLNELPSLPSFMQNGRKYGGCAAISAQTPAQFRAPTAYGDQGAETILNGCQTKVIYRISDPLGAEWASKTLGDVEHQEISEGVRYASSDRGHDVHIGSDRRVRPLVMAAEIAALPNLTCYIQLPEDWPIARTQVARRDNRVITTESFIEGAETGSARAVLMAKARKKTQPDDPPAQPDPGKKRSGQDRRKTTAKPQKNRNVTEHPFPPEGAEPC